MTTYLRMADAAFAVDIPPGFDIAAGYYGGPHAYRVWPAGDWGRFPGFRLPIWVGGYDGATEAAQAAQALQALGVPHGSLTVLDMETRKDIAYVEVFGGELQVMGYKVWVYGSASTVFANPRLDGYWVADYGLTARQLDSLLQSDTIRGVQFAANLPPGYDASLVKSWTEGGMWHG